MTSPGPDRWYRQAPGNRRTHLAATAAAGTAATAGTLTAAVAQARVIADAMAGDLGMDPALRSTAGLNELLGAVRAAQAEAARRSAAMQRDYLAAVTELVVATVAGHDDRAAMVEAMARAEGFLELVRLELVPVTPQDFPS